MYKTLTRGLSHTLGAPLYLILFVNDKCWMYCHHCWFSEDWKEQNLTRPPLSFEEFERLANSIPRLAFLSMTGGEAFMREDIVELATMFVRKANVARYQIPTSGWLPEKIRDNAERMLKKLPHVPFRVDVSLDGTEDIHDEVRNRTGSFSHAVETVRQLRQLKGRYDHFDVGVITTVSRNNQHEVEEIGKVVEEINPDGEWMVNITRGTPRDPLATQVDPQAYHRAHSIIEARMKAGRYTGHSGHLSAPWLSAKNATRRKVIQGLLDGKPGQGGCAAGALGGVIYSDGSTFPCEMLEQSLGNIRDFDCDLTQLWRSPKADEVRDWIQDTRCTCTQECFLSVSLLIQPRHWPDMAMERIKLLRGAAGGV